MATDIKEAIRRLIYQYKVEGADKVMATQEAVAASTTKTEGASLSLEKSFASIERRYVDTVRAQQDYLKVQEKVNAAVAQNPELQERANAVLAAAGKHFDNMAAGASKGDLAATALIRTMSRTVGPIALVGAAVAALSSAFEFFEPIAVRAATAIATKFSEAFPAAGKLAEEMMKVSSEFIKLEEARQKSEAVAAALNGVASAAQLVQLNLKSANEELVKQKSLAEAAQNAERAAEHMKELVKLYPGVTLETAKQLELAEAQLAVAKAITEKEKAIAEELLKQVQLRQQGVKPSEQELLLAKDREIAEAKINAQLSIAPMHLQRMADGMDRIKDHTKTVTEAVEDLNDSLQFTATLAQNIDDRLSMLDTQFENKKYTFAYDPLGLETISETGSVKSRPVTGADLQDAVDYLDVSSAAAIQQSLQDVLDWFRGLGNEMLGPINRLIDAAQPDQQASLIQQAIDNIRSNEQPTLATEEMIKTLNEKLEQLTNSTDSLNSTIQGALSPFYSQDPRTTKLGFRAGVTGNPDWMTGATNANPLVAVLGAGATAPGMANGGSFRVGGGYAANDNRMAVFPVASGEEVIVNRNARSSGGAQIINIDNRIMVTGAVNSDTLSKMKVSRYQQSQRMSRGLAQA